MPNGKKLVKMAVHKFMDVTEHGVGELLPKSKAQKCRDKGGRIIKGECVLFDKVIKDKKSIASETALSYYNISEISEL